MSLTQGALLTICQGGTVNTPVLQILSFKKIAGSSTERYRMLISDGMYSNSCAMLATQLNHLITEKALDEFCIIRVNKHQCNNMQGKKVIIVLELDIINSGSNVGQKIGNPIAINQDGTVNENERKVGIKQPNKGIGDDSDGQPAAKKPFQQVTNRPSMLQDPTPGDFTVYPIASLTPYQNKWTIKARVTSKSDIRRWSNSRGEGHLFSMDLVDESGEIRATAFKEQCDKFYSMIEIGKVYYFSQGTLKAANRQYSNLNNDYEMTFKDSTEVTPCTDASETSAIPTLSFNFCKISALSADLKDSMVDVIGVVKSAEDCTTITSSKTQKEYRKRDITLVDKSLTEVRFTLWGTTAETFDGSSNPVLAIKGAKVSDYNGVTLGTVSSSVVQINPDLPQCHELRGWFDSEGSTMTTNSLSNQGGAKGSSGDMGSNVKTFGEVKKENLGMNSDKPEYYSNLAWVSMITKDKALYQGCPNMNEGKSCNKKVQDQGDGTYRCEKCGTNTPSFNWRMILNVSMADPTDNQWLNSFQEQGEKILGVSAEELGSMMVNDQASYDKVFSTANFSRFNLRIRAKADFYNDEQRVRHTMVAATPLATPSDYSDYCKKMIKELEEAGIPLPDDFNKEKYM